MLVSLQILFSYHPSNFLAFKLVILICFFSKGRAEAIANLRMDRLSFCSFFKVEMLVGLNLRIFVGFRLFSHLLLHLVNWFWNYLLFLIFWLVGLQKTFHFIEMETYHLLYFFLIILFFVGYLTFEIVFESLLCFLSFLASLDSTLDSLLLFVVRKSLYQWIIDNVLLLGF